MLRQATPERLSAFSDGVFAVLITVLVLELRPPEHSTFEALLLLWPTWLSYAVSYLFIAIVWTNHHYLLRYADEATPRLLMIPPPQRRFEEHSLGSTRGRFGGTRSSCGASNRGVSNRPSNAYLVVLRGDIHDR